MTPWSQKSALIQPRTSLGKGQKRICSTGPGGSAQYVPFRSISSLNGAVTALSKHHSAFLQMSPTSHALSRVKMSHGSLETVGRHDDDAPVVDVRIKLHLTLRQTGFSSNYCVPNFNLTQI